jgi:hypothetical protein
MDAEVLKGEDVVGVSGGIKELDVLVDVEERATLIL